jgi:hypothetical protein
MQQGVRSLLEDRLFQEILLTFSVLAAWGPTVLGVPLCVMCARPACQPAGRSTLGALPSERVKGSWSMTHTRSRSRVGTVLAMAVAVLLAWATVAAAGPPSHAGPPTADDAECTLVLGYSQTADWYMAPEGRAQDDSAPRAAAIFEGQVDGDRWQLLWQGGAGPELWLDPNFVGWDNDILFPCASGSDEPDRIVYMVSGPHGDDVEAWVSLTQQAIETIREKFPSAHTIALESIVGGPEGQECFFEGEPVRASVQYPYIAEALRQVAAADEDVVVGALARVKSCNHYVDVRGHLDGPGGASTAATFGQFYRTFDWQ